MLNPNASHIRRASWAVTGLEAGAALFTGGLTLLYLNPFWHFDESGFLDWRVHWWNAAGEILIATGLLTEALALLGSLAVIVSRGISRRTWPYTVACLLVFGAVVWIIPSGLTRDLDAHFEWNVADGFNVFRLQTLDDASAVWHPLENSTLRWMVEIQLQPLLRGYFKLNDWQKMNGDVNVKVARIIPIAWPVALGSGGETLEDPDQTALMRAAVLEDLKTVKELLADSAGSKINSPDANSLGVDSLDQGGQSALILACQNPKTNPEIVKALLAAGANVNLRSRSGYTALTWAQTRNNAEVSRILRRAGGKP
ncbi:MAG: ankyrin repeat domain-containing protein [Candidatus Sulfotelmatobacter sp.]